MTEKDRSDSPDELQRIANWLSLEHTPTATLAALRRMDPRHPVVAFGPLYQLLGERVASFSSDRLQRWALILHCLALVRGRHNSRGVGFGKALAAIHFSEFRLQQLLRADIEVLQDLLPRVARRMATQQAKIDEGDSRPNWWPVRNLALYIGIDESKSEEARQRIAMDYVIASGSDKKAS